MANDANVETLQELEATLLGEPDVDGLLGLHRLEPSQRHALMIAILNLMADVRADLEDRQAA